MHPGYSRFVQTLKFTSHAQHDSWQFPCLHRNICCERTSKISNNSGIHSASVPCLAFCYLQGFVMCKTEHNGRAF